MYFRNEFNRLYSSYIKKVNGHNVIFFVFTKDIIKLMSDKDFRSKYNLDSIDRIPQNVLYKEMLSLGKLFKVSLSIDRDDDFYKDVLSQINNQSIILLK